MSKKKYTEVDVIAACDSYLEGENRHSESASKIWESIYTFIPKKHRLRAAMALGDGLDCDWESEMKYVTDFDD